MRVLVFTAAVAMLATACSGTSSPRTGSVTRAFALRQSVQWVVAGRTYYGPYVETIKTPGMPTSVTIHARGWEATRVPMSTDSVCVGVGLRATWTLVGHTVVLTFARGDRSCGGPDDVPHRLRVTITYA